MVINNKINLRYLILIFFLILFSFFSLRHFIIGPKLAASVDALCPFGGFETLYTYITTGGFVPRILMSSLILAIGILLTVLIFKRGFCGYICPFGTIQELIGNFNKKNIKIPVKYDKYAKYIKYIGLIVILVGTAITGNLIFRSVDPFATFFHFGKGIFWAYEESEFFEHIIPFFITIAILIGSYFVSRIWCKYLCPLGATMNIFNRFSLTKIFRNKTCINCKLCDKVCPSQIKVSKVDYVRDLDCINCNKCVDICPKKSLEIKLLGKKLTSSVYAILVVSLFALVIISAKLIGLWQSVPNLASDFDSENRISGSQIKGWMSLNEVSEASGIKFDDIIDELNLGLYNIDGDIAIKDIQDKYNIEFETELVRELVDNYVSENDVTLNEINLETNIADQITGKMSLMEVSSLAGICLGHLARYLNLSSNINPNIPMKDISETYAIEFHVEDVRNLVANFKHDDDKDENHHIENEADSDIISDSEVDCPWGIKDDPYPGRCGLYNDENKDGLCDLSQ